MLNCSLAEGTINASHTPENESPSGKKEGGNRCRELKGNGEKKTAEDFILLDQFTLEGSDRKKKVVFAPRRRG